MIVALARGDAAVHYSSLAIVGGGQQRFAAEARDRSSVAACRTACSRIASSCLVSPPRFVLCHALGVSQLLLGQLPCHSRMRIGTACAAARAGQRHELQLGLA